MSFTVTSYPLGSLLTSAKMGIMMDNDGFLYGAAGGIVSGPTNQNSAWIPGFIPSPPTGVSTIALWFVSGSYSAVGGDYIKVCATSYGQGGGGLASQPAGPIYVNTFGCVKSCMWLLVGPDLMHEMTLFFDPRSPGF